MFVEISNRAELFLKAIEDIWVAEQIRFGSPNNAVWHCTQAAEKIMKGLLRCNNMDYEYGHKLILLLESVETVFEVSSEARKNVVFLDDYGIGLRYKNLSDDPSPEEAKVAITRTKQIMQEFGKNKSVSNFMQEAEEVHSKILNARKTQDTPEKHND